MSECLFCSIVEGKTKAKTIYQDDTVIAFQDIKPVAPVHALIIPRKHIESVSTLKPEDAALVGAIFLTAAKLAKDFGIAERGYRVVVNNGAAAGQSVFHLHYHLLGGRDMSWPPG
jgi:histidine triad (HIT) family protein